MLRTVRPKNARSKRALDARAPKEIEDARTAIFVKGTHAGERVSSVMKDLMALKRPHCISFSKKNDIHPFDATTSSSGSTSQSSLEFWAAKNDASLFVIGQTTKKRPHGLTLVRMYDGRVLDMCEVGVEEHKSMDSFKTPKPRPGNKPLMHFASELFDTHPRFIQLKSLLISLFNGEVIDSICLNGLEHVISVSLSPTPAGLTTASLRPPPTSTSQKCTYVHTLPSSFRLALASRASSSPPWAPPSTWSCADTRMRIRRRGSRR
ncbi:rRNA-binding ribosome biosynthesis protein rpf2 [Pleurotus ostreatus]|nr:rRNA-binding ribosome biosynthesis protein rpf2 [Pleurotus ostreatus]